jgi:hypothetical protein
VPTDVFDQLWQAVSLSPPVDVEFQGQDPIFPLRFRVGDAGAAVIGASAAMAAEPGACGAVAGGVRVAVDAAPPPCAATSICSAASQGRSRRESIRGLNQDIYRTRDDAGSSASRSAPSARIASVLGGADEHEPAAAVRRWEAAALEDAVVRAAPVGHGPLAREWLAHAQGDGRALALSSPGRDSRPRRCRGVAPVRIRVVT